MEKQEWSVRDIDPNNEILLHGGKWSEEAKRRVSEARRAGRSVMDMFGDLYKKSEKTVSSATKTASNMVRPTAKAVSKTASNLIRVAKKTVFPTTSKTTTGTLGKKSGDKAMAAAGYKKRKIDKKLVARIQDKLDRRYGQGKYKKSESQKLDEKRGKAMDKRENRNKTRKKAEESVAKIKRNETRRAIKAKQKSEKNRSRDAIGENTREKFRNGDMKSGNDALIRKYKGKMKDHMSKSPEERRKNSKQYNEWNQRVKDLEAENKRIGSRNKGSKLEENNTRKMENMYESNKSASESVRRRNASRTKDLEAQNESYYKSKKRKNNIQQSATFDYQAALSNVSKKNQNELKHYGVLGMKWGQHRAKRNTGLPGLRPTVELNNKNFNKFTKLSKKFVRDYNHDAKIDAKSVGASYGRVNLYGKKYIKTVGKDYKKVHKDVDFKNVNQGIAVSSRTGLFIYDNPANPTRRDYAQYLGRDAHVLSKMSREAMVANLKSGDGKKITEGYIEALARRYGKGALAGMRNQTTSGMKYIDNARQNSGRYKRRQNAMIAYGGSSYNDSHMQNNANFVRNSISSQMNTVSTHNNMVNSHMMNNHINSHFGMGGF